MRLASILSSLLQKICLSAILGYQGTFLLTDIFIHSRAERQIDVCARLLLRCSRWSSLMSPLFPRQEFPASCRIRHRCVCSSLLFDSEIGCDSPTYSKQRMNKISPSRWQTSSNHLCWLETQNARWRHVKWRLLEYIYDSLLGNYGHQEDIYLQNS